MLGQFATHAALATRNMRLHLEIERLAQVDSLTGLANRRVFENVLRREVTKAQRSGEPLSLIVFDADYFKQVNDTRGHQAGDEVLRGIAQTLTSVARDADSPPAGRERDARAAVSLPSTEGLLPRGERDA